MTIPQESTLYQSQTTKMSISFLLFGMIDAFVTSWLTLSYFRKERTPAQWVHLLENLFPSLILLAVLFLIFGIGCFVRLRRMPSSSPILIATLILGTCLHLFFFVAQYLIYHSSCLAINRISCL